MFHRDEAVPPLFSPNSSPSSPSHLPPLQPVGHWLQGHKAPSPANHLRRQIRGHSPREESHKAKERISWGSWGTPGSWGVNSSCTSAFQTLNLTNPKTFRDLSKPMGAQTKDRRLKFIQRFKEVEKTEGGWRPARRLCNALHVVVLKGPCSPASE